MRRLIGEITFDMGPGAWICMAAGLCPGIVVAVNVGRGVGERVGGGVWVTVLTGVRATAICVPEMSAA